MVTTIAFNNSFLLLSRPKAIRLEVEQPDLLREIIEIARYGSAAHERRNSDVYRTCKTLDELTAALKRHGST